MIRIYKDNDVKVVTQGAYENIYKSMGYNIVIENKTIKKVEPVIVEEKKPIAIDKKENKQKETVTKIKKSSFKKNKRGE